LSAGAASLRKQLTLDAATALFGAGFSSPGLSVAESYHTDHDTVDGHWGWWIRIEGQFVDIPPAKRAECEHAVRAAIASLETDKGIEFRARCVQRLGNSDQRLAVRGVGPRSCRCARGRARVL
jgi:hypothetical protein